MLLGGNVKDKLYSGILCSFRDCLKVHPGEKIVIVTDDRQLDLAQRFLEVAIKESLDCVIVAGAAQQGGEPPKIVSDALSQADAALLITYGSFSTTRARANATALGVRIASMPSITEKIVSETLTGDFHRLRERTQKLARMMDKANRVRITTELGMDFSFDITGRKACTDTGELGSRGAFGNLPCGEACIAPLEGCGDGKIIVDGVIFGVGIMDTAPLTITMKEGRITAVEGDYRDKFCSFLDKYDEKARCLAEFGIGTNEECRISNNILVDEKVFGTIHLACGTNKFFGGEQLSNIHYDMLIKRPTVFFDDVCVLRDGNHVY